MSRDTPEGMFDLQSGRWYWKVIDAGAGEIMELVDAVNRNNKMRVRLPFTWRRMEPKELRELARMPEMRLWQDDDGLNWRIADIGPGTHYFFPLHTRHLLFDSDKAWAGIVEFPEPMELGDLNPDDLCMYRDRIHDIGGRRQSYRKPSLAS